MFAEVLQVFKELVTAIDNNDAEKIRELVVKYGSTRPEAVASRTSPFSILEKAMIILKRYKIGDNVRMYVLDYSRGCTRWGLLQRWSRGTYAIVDNTGNIELFFSFDKFFNLDENIEWSRKVLEKLAPIEATRKADGTLIIAFYSNILGRWVLGTRRIPHFYDPRSFKTYSIDRIVHPQLIHVVQIDSKFSLDNITRLLDGLEGFVHMFEAVDPADYGDMFYNLGSPSASKFEKEAYVAYLTSRRISDLYLLRYSEAHDVFPSEFKRIEMLDIKDLEEFEKAVKSGKYGEGTVVRYEGADVPYRLVKVKNLLQFKLNLPNIVLGIIYGGIDDLLPEIRKNEELYKKTLELMELVPRLRELLEKYAEFLRPLVDKYGTVEKVRQILHSYKDAVITNVEVVIEHVMGRRTIEQAVFSYCKLLGYEPKKIRRLIARLERFLENR